MTIDAKSKFSDLKVIKDKELSEAAKVAAESVLAVKKDERVLIITNPETDVYSISLAMYDAVIDLDAKPILMERTRPPSRTITRQGRRSTTMSSITCSGKT